MAQAVWSPGSVWIIKIRPYTHPPSTLSSPEASVLTHITPKGPPPCHEGVRATIPTPGAQRRTPCFQPPPRPSAFSLHSHPLTQLQGLSVEGSRPRRTPRQLKLPTRTSSPLLLSPANVLQAVPRGKRTTQQPLTLVPSRRESGMVRRHKPRRSPTTQRTAEKEEWGGASPRTGRGGLHGTRAASAAHPDEHVN